ncbi:hypothetical protein NIES4074_32250 [Cylindrospermum sp. NIES-4074]|nr:hypothetical protein NIES4074_32250 [Cylindrospermum sp. NIES-4074]
MDGFKIEWVGVNICRWEQPRGNRVLDYFKFLYTFIFIYGFLLITFEKS